MRRSILLLRGTWQFDVFLEFYCVCVTFNRMAGKGRKRKESSGSSGRSQVKFKRTDESSMILPDLSSQQSLNVDDSVNNVCSACSALFTIEEADGIFTCVVCHDKVHESCCKDYDSSSMEVIRVVVNDIGWVCEECRELARKVRSDRRFNKENQETSRNSVNSEFIEIRNRSSFLEAKLASLVTSSQGSFVAGVSRTPNFGDGIVKDISNSTACSNMNFSNTLRSDIPIGGRKNTEDLIMNRSSVINLVQKEMQEKEWNSRNIIVSGLVKSALSDKEHSNEICFQCSISVPEIRVCKRVGKESDGRPQLLLISFRDDHSVKTMLDQARLLRNHPNDRIRRHVFINSDLTKAEAKLAFDHRVLKRKAHENKKNEFEY